MNLDKNDPRAAVRIGAIALAVGAIGVVLASLFYALSPVAAALPSPLPLFEAVLLGLAEGRVTIVVAGTIGIFSDLTMIAGMALLLIYRPPAGWVVERLGWALAILSVAVFVVVDTLAAGVLTQLVATAGAGPAVIGFKLLFDTLFVLGTVAFGVSAPMILGSELKSAAPALPRPLLWLGVVAGIVGVIASLLYFDHVRMPQLIGLSIAVGSVVFALYGIALAKRSA